MQLVTPRKDRELFYVDLTDICWVCATYCMRRVKFRGDINEFLNIKPAVFDEHDLDIGDILVWKLDRKGELHATEISGIGAHIITSYHALDRHFGVYEDAGLVSDTALVGDMQIPNIRFRRLGDLIHLPDGVIRLSDKEIISDAATDASKGGE